MQHLSFLLAGLLVCVANLGFAVEAPRHSTADGVLACAPEEPAPLDPMVGDWEVQIASVDVGKLKVWVGPSGTLQAKLGGKKVGITPHGDGRYCVHNFIPLPEPWEDPTFKKCMFEIELNADGQGGAVGSSHGPGKITKV